MLRNSLVLILSLVIALEPAFAKIPPKQHTPQFPGQTYEGVGHFPRPAAADEKAWSEFLTEEIKKAPATNLDKIAQSNTDLVQLMIQYRDFFARSRVEIDTLKAQLNDDEKFLKEYLDASKVNYTDPVLGKMEFSSIDGHPVGKITHQPSGVSFLIYDESEVARTSKHLELYLARQHYDAGATRKETHYIDENGKKQKIRAGRDTVLMGIKTKTSNEVTVEVAARKRGFKNWWHATYKTPSQRNVMEGFFSGILQFGSSWALAEMVAHILPGYVHGDTPLLVAGFTFAFGSIIGIWNSFYQNWRVRGSKGVRDLKALSVSLAYYFGVALITSAGAQEITVTDPSMSLAQTVGFFQAFFDSIVTNPAQFASEQIKNAKDYIAAVTGASALALAAKTHFIHNFVANNELKNMSIWLQRIPEIERRDLKVHTAEIPIPYRLEKNKETEKYEVKNWNLKVGISQRFLNRQVIYYLPVNWTKFVDQVWFGTTIGPALAGDLPMYMPFLSVLGFWSVIIGSNYWVNWWAYKHHSDAAERLKIREDVPYYFPSYYVNGLKNVFQKTSAAIKTRSQQVMKFLGLAQSKGATAAQSKALTSSESPCETYFNKDRNAS